MERTTMSRCTIETRGAGYREVERVHHNHHKEDNSDQMITVKGLSEDTHSLVSTDKRTAMSTLIKAAACASIRFRSQDSFFFQKIPSNRMFIAYTSLC